MAAHFRDEMLHGEDHGDTHASANRWRHQESRSFARHASPRAPDERHGSKELADFLNSSRVELPKSAGSGERHKPIAVAGNAYTGSARPRNGESRGQDVPDSYTELEVKCGPLLNYRRMENETWFGSVLIVTKGGGLGGGAEPQLIWKTVGSSSGSEGSPSSATEHNGKVNGSNVNQPPTEPHGTVNGVDYTSSQGPASIQIRNNANIGNDKANGIPGKVGDAGSIESKVPGTKLYSDALNTFWRFDLEVQMQQSEIEVAYRIPDLKFVQGTKTDKQSFFIPAVSESMRIMFHSCNGFSVGTDEEAWSGPALWNDVMRIHQKTPFHVM
jgi:hypothetical protein